jgi:hypothetical protein
MAPKGHAGGNLYVAKNQKQKISCQAPFTTMSCSVFVRLREIKQEAVNMFTEYRDIPPLGITNISHNRWIRPPSTTKNLYLLLAILV